MHRLSSHSAANLLCSKTKEREFAAKHFNGGKDAITAREYLLAELNALENMAAITAQSMMEHGGALLVVSLATLTWRREEVSRRLLGFLPAIKSLDAAFSHPHSKADASFGATHPPGPTCGFDMATHTCAFATCEYAEPVLLRQELQRANISSALLALASGFL